MKRKIGAWISAAVLCLTSVGAAVPAVSQTVSAAGTNQVEYLNRGISAINTGSGMLVSWRFLANDSDSAVFQLYRNNTLIYTSNAGESTCYLDAGGKSTDAYRVDTVEGGKVVSSENCALISNQSYFQLNLDPPTGSGCTYSPNDCSVGDVDGDGTYEIPPTPRITPRRARPAMSSLTATGWTAHACGALTWARTSVPAHITPSSLWRTSTATARRR